MGAENLLGAPSPWRLEADGDHNLGNGMTKSIRLMQVRG